MPMPAMSRPAASATSDAARRASARRASADLLFALVTSSLQAIGLARVQAGASTGWDEPASGPEAVAVAAVCVACALLPPLLRWADRQPHSRRWRSAFVGANRLAFFALVSHTFSASAFLDRAVGPLEMLPRALLGAPLATRAAGWGAGAC